MPRNILISQVQRLAALCVSGGFVFRLYYMLCLLHLLDIRDALTVGAAGPLRNEVPQRESDVAHFIPGRRAEGTFSQSL